MAGRQDRRATLQCHIAFAKSGGVWQNVLMHDKQPTPLQASFWLTDQEKGYILAIGALLLIGVVARYFYLKNEPTQPYAPTKIEPAEAEHE